MSHHYVTEGDVLKPVCENKDEYVVAEGEEVILNLKKVEIITFAQWVKTIMFQYLPCT